MKETRKIWRGEKEKGILQQQIKEKKRSVGMRIEANAKKEDNADIIIQEESAASTVEREFVTKESPVDIDTQSEFATDGNKQENVSVVKIVDSFTNKVDMIF